MVKTKELKEFERIEIIRLNAEGLSQTQIARQVGCTQPAISYTLKRYNQHKTIRNLSRSGRKKISTPRDQRNLINIVKQNRKLCSQQLSQLWKLSNDKTASPRTVRKVLQDHNYLWRPACKKPRLTKIHKIKRQEFCQRYKSWTKLRWEDVLFSDEMNVEVDQRKCRVMLRRTVDEKYNESCIQQRTKQGSGSIGIWACMSASGVHCFKLFNGRLNAVHYREILENFLMPTIDASEDKEHLIFQQDNAPCHTAHIIRDFFADNNIKTLTWPPNSPDLNCIENLWSWLDIKLGKLQIYDLDTLKLEISNLLQNVPKTICQNLSDSMPTRLNECLEVRGGMTRY